MEEADNSPSSREKTTQWLEVVLETYYNYERKKDLSLAERESLAPLGLKVKDFDIGPGYDTDGTISTLSELLSIKATFTMGSEAEEKTEHLVVKIPPSDLGDREMAHLAQVDKREIHFYTEALVQMESYIKERGASISLGVPKCYFAKYHYDAELDDEEENEEGGGGERCYGGIPEAQSVLVLQDIRPLGFSMRDCSLGLSIQETKAALRQIAIFHTVSWAMQEQDSAPLAHRWTFSYRPKKAATAYRMMIEQGFPTLAGFLEKKEPDGAELLSKLKNLHPRAADLLCELLEPPPPPIPSCLTHMDFWCNNLLFRSSTSPPHSDNLNVNENKNVNENVNVTGIKVEGEEETECAIVDWQMMTISRPTHDVALLLFTSLTPEIRQEHTGELLDYYWTIFKETAEKLKVEIPFGFACLEEEFKKSQLLALLLVIGSIDLALDAEATENRLISAIRDIAKGDLL